MNLGDSQSVSLETIAAMAGRGDMVSASRSLVEPIYQTSVFQFPDITTADAVQSGEVEGYTYTRGSTPNATSLERTLAALEGADAALACSSGMSALMVVFLGMLRAGDHVVAPRDAYGGTYDVLSVDLSRFGVVTTYVDMTDHTAVTTAVRSHPRTRLIVAEIIGNPLMSVCDVAVLADIAHAAQATLLVDNTFASPVVCRPLSWGADVVVHSASKFIGGHHDVISGVVAGKQADIDALRGLMSRTGAIISPFDAWLTLRGAKTLPLRVRASCENAAQVARFLCEQPNVRHVYYPGLPEHPQHSLATRQFGGCYGAMLSFEMHGGLDEANAVLSRLRLLAFAPSLGGVNSTVSHPVSTSHRSVPLEERRRAGIVDGMIRVSIGIEDAADIVADFEQALRGV